MNRVGFHLQPGATRYVLALTLFLVVGWLIFVENLGLFFGETPSH